MTTLFMALQGKLIISAEPFFSPSFDGRLRRDGLVVTETETVVAAKGMMGDGSHSMPRSLSH
eukprot:2072228-Ditylum_brightwellii.AAC.1